MEFCRVCELLARRKLAIPTPKRVRTLRKSRERVADPFTGRNDTWRSEKSGGRFEVHSGADAVSSGGTLHSSWQRDC